MDTIDNQVVMKLASKKHVVVSMFIKYMHSTSMQSCQENIQHAWLSYNRAAKIC